MILNRYSQFVTLMLFLAHIESNLKSKEKVGKVSRYFVIIFNQCFDFQAEIELCIKTLRHEKGR